MDIKIVKSKKLEATPKYAKHGDAGIDLVAVEVLKENDRQITYGTGLSIEIPIGYVGMIYPRSSIRKKPIMMSNSVGVIDSGYRGEIQVTFNKLDDCVLPEDVYEVGNRICQLVIIAIPTINLIPVQKLSDSDRGKGGHGSTGV